VERRLSKMVTCLVAGSSKAARAVWTAQRRISQRMAVPLLAKTHQRVHRQRADFHHKEALKRYNSTTRTFTRTCRRPTSSRITISPSPSLPPTAQSLPCRLLTPTRSALAVVSWLPRACRSAGALAQSVARACSKTTTPRRMEKGLGRAVGEPWRRLRRRPENIIGECLTLADDALPYPVDPVGRFYPWLIFARRFPIFLEGGDKASQNAL